MVKVYAPASIGNVSVGFDLLGAAVAPLDGSLLGDVVTVLGQGEEGVSLRCQGPFATYLPTEPKDNIVYRCGVYFCAELAKRQPRPVPDMALNVALLLDKNLPVGSGLGSSATSIVATLHALNLYFEQPFSETELLLMMGKFEGQLSGSVHYDNVAPCYLGGLQLMTGEQNICQSLPVCEDWYWVIAYSGIKVSTKMAREVLPTQVPMATAIDFGRHLAAFIDASHRRAWSEAATHIVDVLAQPHRQSLLPGFAAVSEKLRGLGAKASGISGSGPTLFAVADSWSQAQQFKALLLSDYIHHEQGFCHICSIDQQGAREVSPDVEA